MSKLPWSKDREYLSAVAGKEAAWKRIEDASEAFELLKKEQHAAIEDCKDREEAVRNRYLEDLHQLTVLGGSACQRISVPGWLLKSTKRELSVWVRGKVVRFSRATLREIGGDYSRLNIDHKSLTGDE